MALYSFHKVPELVLNNGVKIPAIGFGTWPLDDNEAYFTLRSAIDIGWRLIDTAENYENEVGVGKAIKSCGIPREEIFLTSKFNRKWHSVDGVTQAYEASLKRLDLDYIDLFLIHWPNPDQGKYLDAFEGLQKLYEKGLVRAIGVSNFKETHLQKLFDAGFIPQINQIQLDPTRPRKEIVAANQSKKIITESWSPLDRGGPLLLNEKLKTIAAKHDKSVGQIILRWNIEKGYIPLPKSSSPSRQKENIDIFDFNLSQEDIGIIDSLYNPNAEILDPDKFGH